ncbi:hypothetical protein [Cognatilysobacter bugurensis]|uniref:hypothetical protein n=1 Tax=Cognatilysobacter bugurensis TaxID=543356 RepID=UPI001674328D|nr:hypothetical protein [Lysobacter bugurensis]
MLLYAVLSLAISIIAFYSWVSYSGLPELSQLKIATGRIVWVEKGRYGIRFDLERVPEDFNYASKGGAVDRVHSAINSAVGQPITVWFDPAQTVGAPGTDEEFYEVYQLSVSGSVVRPLKDVEEAWGSDMKFALWLSAFFALNGVFLGIRAWRPCHAA